MAWRKGSDYGATDTMMAFMFVARNRFNAGWGDWLSVIKGMYQLGDEGYPSLADTDFRSILQSVDFVQNGSQPDKLTEGALYWAELPADDGIFSAEVKPLLTTVVPCAKVGQVSFFK